MKGKPPSKEQIATLAEELQLSENQIYKWFWDTKKKLDEEEQNGGLVVKSSSSTGGRTEVYGDNGQGQSMTPLQIKQALKIHNNNTEKEMEFERIAERLGINVENLAQEIVQMPSPKGTRQIVRSIKKETTTAQPPSRGLPTFGTSLFTSAQTQNTAPASAAPPKLTRQRSKEFQQ